MITILDQMVSESTQRSTVITILDQVVSESTWRSSDNNFRPGGFWIHLDEYIIIILDHKVSETTLYNPWNTGSHDLTQIS